MERIEWQIKNQNAKYKVSENLSKESSINISKEIFEFLGAKQSGDIITVILHKNDFLLAFSNLVSNLPLFYYRNGSQKAEFNSEFFESNYNEIKELFGDNERIEYQIKVRINDESTTRYYLYRMDGTKNFIIRDFLIGEYSVLHFIKNDNGEIIIKPVLNIVKKEDNMFEDSPSTQTPTQTIFYGVPGSGKSHSIKKELATKRITDLKEQTKRVVFHPEYTNADFVGQILPQSSDGGKTISYPFVPGPFTQILAKAYTHKNTHYALIIEEINRGNAAAIFGELFQLLDRLDEDETESSNEVAYTKGWSSYSINNDNINKAIQEAYENFKSDSNFEPFINKEIFDTYKLNIGIRLPPNLSIFATMNTSDQNVFKLDNAFKRRWELRLIPNKFKEEQEEINQRDAVVESFDFTWNNFREAVNSIIIDPDNSIDISSFADRQIGCWFTKAIKKEEKYIIEKEVFVYKVLEYLWDDVCNGDIGLFFNEKYKSFAELVEDVIQKGITDIFSENLKVILSQNKTE